MFPLDWSLAASELDAGLSGAAGWLPAVLGLWMLGILMWRAATRPGPQDVPRVDCEETDIPAP